MRRRPEPGRWSNLWWEILVALLLVCGLTWGGWRAAQPGGWVLPAMFSQWILVTLLVLSVASFVAQSYRPLLRSPVFCGVAGIFLAALGTTAYFWFSVGGLNLLSVAWFGPVGGAEFAAFAYIAYRKFHVLPRTKKLRSAGLIR